MVLNLKCINLSIMKQLLLFAFAFFVLSNMTAQTVEQKIKQITKNEDELHQLYIKLNIPEHLAKNDATKNQLILQQCTNLGAKLTSEKYNGISDLS